jgi:hypothetical protein
VCVGARGEFLQTEKLCIGHEEGSDNILIYKSGFRGPGEAALAAAPAAKNLAPVAKETPSKHL